MKGQQINFSIGHGYLYNISCKADSIQDCSGQNMAAPQDSDTCQPHQECVKQATNSTYQLAHIQPRGESPEVRSEFTFNPEGESLPTPSSHSTPRRGPRAPSILRHPQLPNLSPPSLTQLSSRISRIMKGL